MAMTGAEPLDIRRLLEPLGVDRFFAEFWLRRTVAFDLEPGMFARLREEIGEPDIARLAGLATGGTQAWIANEHIAHSVVPVDASSAKLFFDAGASLYFINVPLNAVTRPFAVFLGVPSTRVLASFFLTPGGGGASRHFDAHENFTIQLTGAKRWNLGKTPLITAPPDGFVLGSRLPPSLVGMMDDDGASGAADPVDLRPGTLLYIPRGTLHDTEAAGASWSLNISYACTMWVDLVCAGLRQRLSKSPRWRGSLAGLARADSAVLQSNILPELIGELRELLADKEQVDLLWREFFHIYGSGEY